MADLFQLLPDELLEVLILFSDAPSALMAALSCRRFALSLAAVAGAWRRTHLPLAPDPSHTLRQHFDSYACSQDVDDDPLVLLSPAFWRELAVRGYVSVLRWAESFQPLPSPTEPFLPLDALRLDQLLQLAAMHKRVEFISDFAKRGYSINKALEVLQRAGAEPELRRLNAELGDEVVRTKLQLALALESGNLALVQWCYEGIKRIPPLAACVRWACGSAAVFKWAMQIIRNATPPLDFTSLLSRAGSTGDLELIKAIYDESPSSLSRASGSLPLAAASAGHLYIIRWVEETVGPLGNYQAVLYNAYRSLQIDVSEHCLSKGASLEHYKWPVFASSELAFLRAASVAPGFAWCLQKGLLLPSLVDRSATAWPLEVIRHIHEKHKIPLHPGIELIAAQRSRLDLLKYLVARRVLDLLAQMGLQLDKPLREARWLIRTYSLRPLLDEAFCEKAVPEKVAEEWLDFLHRQGAPFGSSAVPLQFIESGSSHEVQALARAGIVLAPANIVPCLTAALRSRIPLMLLHVYKLMRRADAVHLGIVHADGSWPPAKDELDGLREKVVALVDPPTAQPVAQEAVEEIFENITY